MVAHGGREKGEEKWEEEEEEEKEEEGEEGNRGLVPGRWHCAVPPPRKLRI
jgi:hypothetical protein